MTAQTKAVYVSVRISTVVAILAAAIVALSDLHTGVLICWKTQSCGLATASINQYGYLFDLNNKASISTWFSTAELFTVAICLGYLAAIERARGSASLAWWGLAAIFVVLSLDEATELHGLLQGLVGPTVVLGMKSSLFDWVVPASVIVVAVVAVYIRWVLELPARTRNLFLIAGATYVFGAIVLEAVGGLVVDETFRNTAYLFVSTVAEIMEMAGVLVMLYAVLQYLGQYAVALHFRPNAVRKSSAGESANAIAGLLPPEPLAR